MPDFFLICHREYKRKKERKKNIEKCRKCIFPIYFSYYFRFQVYISGQSFLLGSLIGNKKRCDIPAWNKYFLLKDFPLGLQVLNYLWEIVMPLVYWLWFFVCLFEGLRQLTVTIVIIKITKAGNFTHVLFKKKKKISHQNFYYKCLSYLFNLFLKYLI